MGEIMTAIGLNDKSFRVSVAMPVYNGERYISEALESVLGQTYCNIEAIVVNDGSKDGSYEKIKKYLRLPNVKYIEQENRGVASARNTAIRNSSGDLIAFLDQDDLWVPDKIEAQVDYLRSHPDVGLVHSDIDYIDENGRAAKVDFKWKTDVEGECFRELFIRNGIAVLTVLLRKSCFDEAGLFNESLSCADDYEMWLRVSRRFKIGHVKKPLARYRIHSSNTSYDYIRMALAEEGAVRSALGELKDPYGELGKKTVAERLFELNSRIGGIYTWQKKDFRTARRYFLRAVKARPLRIEGYRELLWCLLVPSQRRAIQWYLGRLKRA